VARDARTVEERRGDILNAAADLIVKFGYAGTSLDAIVEAAGCSKSIVYNYFGDKQGLLAALSEGVVHELSRALNASDRAHLGVEETLTVQVEKMLELVLSDKYIAVLRVIMSEFWNTPKLGQAYYKLGPRAAQHQISEYLTEQADAGKLNIADAMHAAEDFLALVLWNKQHARMVGVARAYPPAEIEAQAKAAVSSFLRLYASS